VKFLAVALAAVVLSACGSGEGDSERSGPERIEIHGTISWENHSTLACEFLQDRAGHAAEIEQQLGAAFLDSSGDIIGTPRYVGQPVDEREPYRIGENCFLALKADYEVSLPKLDFYQYTNGRSTFRISRTELAASNYVWNLDY
jgi:hypothetical protein